MTVILAFVSIVTVLLWTIGLMVLMDKSVSSGAWTWTAVTVVYFALPVAILMASVMAADDPNADRLCLRGHEEWVTRRQAPVFVGKALVPRRPVTEKVWVCEAWED